MTEIPPAHIVGTGGALGALLRYYVNQSLDQTDLPVGTLTVNVLGTFLLAVVTFGGASHDLLLLLGVGLCGSFTTFSTFSFETVRLWEAGRKPHAIGIAVGNLAGAGFAIGLAWLFTGALFGF
ncbi:fluoride efflux transporter CrcB [Halorussus aquaticus]|uniref:Fluoride-specific ion channel FluC n=1 Tax=Halorussus aquaticus TaxID=2953748 RepID=A0ABD5Q7Q4_9EURY|nr:fluoride efflux transporter CrcB [Halorussus aquaticus]